MHKTDDSIKATLNRMGFTFLDLMPCSLDFIEFASKTNAPILDIGCAFGVATIPCLTKGARVTANDLSHEHLTALKENTPDDYKDNLTLLHGNILELELGKETYGAIHASQVIHFFTGIDIEQVVHKFYETLLPGGKVFIGVGTPYISMLENFLPVYEKRKKDGDKWPGELSNFWDYCPDHLCKDVPSFVNFLDTDILERVFMDAGFEIETNTYYKRPNLSENFGYDGRENVMLIAVKPS